MSPHDRLISVRQQMDKPATLPHQVAALGYEVWCLSRTLEATEANGLIHEFHEYARKHGFADVLDRQIDYAERLIRANRRLLYEEVQKLFALCDEIECLRLLGCDCVEGKHAQFEHDLRMWFANNATVAHSVAQDSIEEWKSGWWWYGRVALEKS